MQGQILTSLILGSYIREIVGCVNYSICQLYFGRFFNFIPQRKNLFVCLNKLMELLQISKFCIDLGFRVKKKNILLDRKGLSLQKIQLLVIIASK